MQQALNHKQVVSLIKAVGQHRTVLVQGPAGAGKTSILYDLAKDPAFADYHIVNPIDCTQLSDGSVWMPDIDRDAGVSRELPNERFGMSQSNRKGVDGSRPALICLDEIAKARQSIKDTIAPIVYERRIGDYHMPEGSIVFACTNLSMEGLGDTMQAHLRDRLVTVTMRMPTKDEWLQDFALDRGLHEAVLGAVEEYPMVFDSFTDYMPGGKHAGKTLHKENPYIFDPSSSQDKWVTPRSLHAASDILHNAGQLDEGTLEAALSGTVGRAFAAQMASFIRFGNDLPPFSRIVSDPENAPLPSNPTAQSVLVFKLITQVQDTEQAGACVTYVQRLRAEMQTMFTTHVARTSAKLVHFTRAQGFAALLASNRKFFSL